MTSRIRILQRGPKHNNFSSLVLLQIHHSRLEPLLLEGLTSDESPEYSRLQPAKRGHINASVIAP